MDTGNRLMIVCTRIAIIVGLLLGGVPHALCACGCGDGVEQKAERKCPHCDDRDAPTGEEPNPCKCRNCSLVKAVVGASPANDHSFRPVFRLASAPVPSVQPVAVRSVSHGSAMESPGSLPPPCGLPILLEHLLF